MESPVEQIWITIFDGGALITVAFTDGTQATIPIPSVVKPAVMLKEVEALIRKVEQPYLEEIARLSELLEVTWEKEEDAALDRAVEDHDE